jgi:hypothetical protein
VLYIGIHPQYCIESISTQEKQDPIQPNIVLISACFFIIYPQFSL